MDHSPPGNRPVFLSASLPDELKGTRRAKALEELVAILVHGIFSSMGRIVCGGHPTVTPLIHRYAREICPSEARTQLFQLERFRGRTPPEVDDHRVFELTWVPTLGPEEHWVEKELSVMRRLMAERSGIAVFAGGRTLNNVGKREGIEEEYEAFTDAHPCSPAYLVGLLGGSALKLIREHERQHKRESNTLSDSELFFVHNSNDVDLVGGLILADLRRHLKPVPANPGE
jgi:hypothetical protein